MFADNLIVESTGLAYCHGKKYRCTLGKAGVTASKREGDLKTPIGHFKLRCVYYRPDKFYHRIKTRLPLIPITNDLGWCDDPTSRYYNQPIRKPFIFHHETLWREDDLYDLVVVVGYNDNPVKFNRGSAIFIHIATQNYISTQGCIAFHLSDLLEILTQLDHNSCVIIRQNKTL